MFHQVSNRYGSQGRPIFIRGMGGLGDSILQRACIRVILKRDQTTYLQTPWPCLYHDFANLRLVRSQSVLRTQGKNERRELAKYYWGKIPNERDYVRIWYSHESILRQGSVLAAMLHDSGLRAWDYDFSLPIPDAWHERAVDIVARGRGKPILIYRPLVVRTEWEGCEVRNPDPVAYHAIFQSIRDRFFVISIADLVPRFEWIVSKPIKADLEFHRGELTIETMAALFQHAALVYSPSGFAPHLAHAVGTPVVAIFGGYE